MYQELIALRREIEIFFPPYFKKSLIPLDDAINSEKISRMLKELDTFEKWLRSKEIPENDSTHNALKASHKTIDMIAGIFLITLTTAISAHATVFGKIPVAALTTGWPLFQWILGLGIGGLLVAMAWQKLRREITTKAKLYNSLTHLPKVVSSTPPHEAWHFLSLVAEATSAFGSQRHLDPLINAMGALRDSLETTSSARYAVGKIAQAIARVGSVEQVHAFLNQLRPILDNSEKARYAVAQMASAIAVSGKSAHLKPLREIYPEIYQHASHSDAAQRALTQIKRAIQRFKTTSTPHKSFPQIRLLLWNVWQFFYQFERRLFRKPLHPSKTAVLVLDAQEDFLGIGPGFAFYDRQIIMKRNDVKSMQQKVEQGLLPLIRWAEDQGIPVFYTQSSYEPDHFPDLPQLCIPGTPGWEIFHRIKPHLSGKALVFREKHSNDAFSDPGLRRALRRRGITDLILAGVTNRCLEKTALSEHTRGLQIHVIPEATASAAYNHFAHEATLKRLSHQPHVQLVNLDQLSTLCKADSKSPPLDPPHTFSLQGLKNASESQVFYQILQISYFRKRFLDIHPREAEAFLRDLSLMFLELYVLENRNLKGLEDFDTLKKYFKNLPLKASQKLKQDHRGHLKNLKVPKDLFALNWKHRKTLEKQIQDYLQFENLSELEKNTLETMKRHLETLALKQNPRKAKNSLLKAA
jgi:nicotinamidase-related amidase